jgi:hypothetical protein
MTPEDRWPGYTPEAQAYEIATRPKARYPHVDYSRLPAHMQDGARGYIERGEEPGGFLTAVLCNDLVAAFSRADADNAAAMAEWARWLWNEAPSQAWGSRAKVDAWIDKHGENER